MDERMNETINQLRKITKGKELKSLIDIAERFSIAIAAGARTEARDLLKEVFELEKKYVPLIPHNKFMSQRLQCRNMIMTVGGSKEPIILSILCLKPQKAILLHTDGSADTALEIETDPDINDIEVEITRLLITEYDASQNYRVIREQALPRISHVEKEITLIDPTGGRKVMVASLALAAFYHRFQMVYIHSIEESGIVFPFTERLRIIENPFEFFGDTELGLVQEQFNCHLYEAAFNTCIQLSRKVRDAATLTKVNCLQELVKVYMDWDSFMHSAVPEDKRPKPPLSEKLEGIVADFQRLALAQYLPDNINANLEYLRKLDKTWRDNKNIVDELRLVDIFSSALRREKQKKYDDAVGRLYRCLEMSATLKLIEKGLKDTKEPDYKSFCSNINKDIKNLGIEFEKKKRRKLPNERLGLDDQMGLLDIAGENIARIYEGIRRRRRGSESLMDIRNRSILAHGTNPIPDNLWPEFKNKTEVVIQNTIGKDRFKNLLNMALHGQIYIGL
ncbi:TIGR02710 family CRISPR-associated protein [Candidatus Poribacteria bacterium]|nr:TIGR02710 family CRISPR-associated protein [Candidatus Poribacteria bacterium]